MSKMAVIKVISVFSLIGCVINGFLVVHDAPRKVVKVLTVDNGGRWGDWHGPHFCADGTYAVGYNMKIEPYQQGGDDTAMDGVLIRCESFDGHFGGDVGSGESNWGTWVGMTRCDNQAGLHHFITGFQLQVEEYQERKVIRQTIPPTVVPGTYSNVQYLHETNPVKDRLRVRRKQVCFSMAFLQHSLSLDNKSSVGRPKKLVLDPLSI